MVNPNKVHETLSQFQLVDGFPQVLDLEKSQGVWLHDSCTGEDYLDFFTSFASWPIGYNHPMMNDSDFLEKLSMVGSNNPANSDIYTKEMAEFVEAFATHVTPSNFNHHFWVAGGALAVENALKTAFDWKARKLGRSIEDSADDLVILHLKDAFHGRSGYTLSLTNTDPVKTALFPKFNWPRFHNPTIIFDLDGNISNDIESEESKSIEDIENAFETFKDRIAAIIIEPMQGEGGDNHFRTNFFKILRNYADQNEALLIYDEVQTGFWGSGKPWLWQHHDVAPDIAAFGKKTQVCGIYASNRIDEVKDNVFSLSSRINSTWGGNLVDMVRSKRFIDIIRSENLGENISNQGQKFILGLRNIAASHNQITNVRGVGSLIAFTLPDGTIRDTMINNLLKNNILALKSGPTSIRFRLPLIISEEEVSTALERIEASID
tara:strand:+ start:10276 stop:11580 length:1305 start_codon:yes stop_codon:yes gene_type:complete